MRWPGNPKLSSDRVLGVKRKEQCNPNFSGAHKVSDPRVGLLGPNAVGRYRRAAEQRDELTPPHSRTSLARAMNTSDNETPSDAAVLRLTAM
jgi:hypothetical protein